MKLIQHLISTCDDTDPEVHRQLRDIEADPYTGAIELVARMGGWTETQAGAMSEDEYRTLDMAFRAFAHILLQLDDMASPMASQYHKEEVEG